MSFQANKSSSWFARAGRAAGGKRGAKRERNYRGLRFESLESRSLLSATLLPSISGVVYQNLTGSSLAGSNSPLPNIAINLFRDGGDGIFEGEAPGSDDTLAGTTSSEANGRYVFANLSPGTYFVQQAPVPGMVVASGQGVQKVVVTNADLQGAKGMMIDSFATTPQFVGASAHGGRTGQSSQYTSAAIGGHRNLYVQLTTAGGAIDMARTPIGPACWTSAPTRPPTAPTGSTGTATTATPPR